MEDVRECVSLWEMASAEAGKVCELHPHFCCPEHAGGNRAEGGGLIGALGPQRKPAAGGQGPHEGRGWAAGRKAEDPQGEPPGAAESPAWQAAEHPGEGPAPESKVTLQGQPNTWRALSEPVHRKENVGKDTYLGTHLLYTALGMAFPTGFVRAV